MNRTAPTDHPIHELLATRYSPRAFGEDPITEEELASLMEAARWAPSSFNEQPWRFVIAPKDDTPEAHERILGLLSEGNQRWAGRAPVLVVAATSTHFDRTGNPNRHARHDLGQALALMTVQATSMSIGVHQMAGFDAARAQQALGIPEGFEAVTAVALGHHADPTVLPEDLQKKETAPRSRRPQDEFVFAGSWPEES